MSTPTLSARLATIADQLHQTAHLVAPLNQRLGATLILHTVQLGLAGIAAAELERELRASRRTTDELAAEITADATTQAARDQHARHSRIIANLPGLTARPCHLRDGDAA